MAATGEQETTLTFVMSTAEREMWDTFSAEQGLALADVVQVAALRGLKYWSKAAGDEIRAIVAERCERELLEFLGKREGTGTLTPQHT